MSSKLKLRLFGWITFINVTVGVSLGGLLYTIWPDHYFRWFPSIPLFYWLTALIMVYVLDKVKHHKRNMSVTMFMLVRTSRFLLACIFLWMYAALVGENLRSFGFTLMLFYFIYLTIETYTNYMYEKKRLKRIKEEKDGQSKK